MKKVAIVGGGPAGMMLAATLDPLLYNVTIYERNVALGRKFLVAGDGGLNLTHSEEIDILKTRYTPVYFLDKSLNSFTNQDLTNWFLKLGVETFVGTSKRVFPIQGTKPIEVLNTLLGKLHSLDVQINKQHEWIGWQDNHLKFAHENDQISVESDIVVFALGGASWSKTGSKGNWLSLFEEKGIKTVPFQSSNCAFRVAWKNSVMTNDACFYMKNISVECDGHVKKGELVMTQFGLEGGAIYALSSEIRKKLSDSGNANIFIDLKPDFSIDQLKDKLKKEGKQTVTKLLKEKLNLSDAHIALLKSELSKDIFLNIEQLAEKIKGVPVSILGLAPIEEAISTVGGIDIEEVDKIFQLKKIPNHYVIGEMLDWDAPTGGYLLQACFSMGAFLGQNLNQSNF